MRSATSKIGKFVPQLIFFLVYVAGYALRWSWCMSVIFLATVEDDADKKNYDARPLINHGKCCQRFD